MSVASPAPAARAISSKSDFRRAYALLAWAVFLLTWLKGFRLPNLWSANTFAFNYSQGFVRRGLLGEIARQLGGDTVFRYELFVVVAFVLFFAAAYCLAVLIRRALRSDQQDLGFMAAVLAFAASPGLVFFVHTIGYTDYVGIICVLGIVLWSQRSKNPFLVFYVIIVASVFFSLVHEGMALLLGPALMFVMLCHILRISSVAPLGKSQWLALLAHAIVCSALLLSLSNLLSLIGVEDLDRVQRLKHYVETHADFPARFDAFDALQRSSKENLTRLMPWYWTLDIHVRPAQRSWAAFAPAYLWLMVYGISAIRRALSPHPAVWMVTALFLGASIAPQAFNLVGWDWGRWNAFALLSCFICILTLKTYFPSLQPNTMNPVMISAGLVATAIGLTSTTPLFDGVEVQFFPFDAHLQLLRRWFEQGMHLRPG